jgi:C4-dicarboxylate-specific signal transduction histidine kinase
MLLPDGTLRHIRAKAKLVSPTLYVGCATDITERRVAESKVRRAHTELATAARLRTLGELAASITHELSQPLTAVVAHAAAGRRSLTATEPDAIGARLSVEALLEDARRAQGVISSLRTLARKSEPERRPVDIDAAVSEIVALLRGEIEAVGVDVRCALGAGGRRLMVDRVQIQQVVLTLIMTCLEGLKDAAYAPVPLSIRTYWSDGGAFQMVISGPARIADPPPMNARFELLAPDATGEQLGLAVCVSIVEAHGGSLTRVTSDLGGIAFELRLEEGEPA